MYTGIFDTHAHYDDERFDVDRRRLLSSLPSKGIIGVVNCAVELNSCEKSKVLSERYDYIYFAAGIHPHECSELSETYIFELKKYLVHKKCVAVGEIGLDYHYDFAPKGLQKKAFEEQLILAKEYGLPVIIHNRDAHADTLELLNKYRPRGIMHCFSGSKEMAENVIKIGMYIGFGGSVTFKNAKKPVEAAKYVPLDKLALETDCPYMTPVPHRGERNDSSLIPLTAEFIAELKNIPAQELINITAENAGKIFFKK